MSKIEKAEFTNMCMICDGDKVVVIDRQKKDWPGITFPGGHVETGESFTDSVIREVKEETGLNIHCPTLCGIKDWYSEGERYVVFMYKATDFDGELISSGEGKVWWEKIDNLPNLKLSIDMLDMIRVFIEESLSEFFYYKQDGKWLYDLK